MYKGLVYTVIVIVLAFTIGTLQIRAYTCQKAWANSGMTSEWQFGAGCMLQLPDKTWIPARNYRAM